MKTARIVWFAFIGFLGTGHALAQTNATCSPSCTDLFSSEFDVSRLICHLNASVCPCTFQVLDLTACATKSSSAEFYNLYIDENPNASSNRYTAECRANIHQKGPCNLGYIRDNGFMITSLETLFSVLGVLLEIISLSHMVIYPLPNPEKFAKILDIDHRRRNRL